ncbi:hypothetical protein SSTU70S_00690 [Stutzerimonas stutzeri]
MTDQSHDLPLPTGKYVTLNTGLTLLPGHRRRPDRGLAALAVARRRAYSTLRQLPWCRAGRLSLIIVDLPGFGRIRQNRRRAIQPRLLRPPPTPCCSEALDIQRAPARQFALGARLHSAPRWPPAVETILMALGGVEERETCFPDEGAIHGRNLRRRPHGHSRCHVMGLGVRPRQPALILIPDAVAVAVTQPANLFSTMMVPNMTEWLGELTCPCSVSAVMDPATRRAAYSTTSNTRVTPAPPAPQLTHTRSFSKNFARSTGTSKYLKKCSRYICQTILPVCGKEFFRYRTSTFCSSTA